MGDSIQAANLAAGHALCRERCAAIGEPPCWQVKGNDGQPLPWPPETCDCATEAPVAVAAFLRALPDHQMMQAHGEPPVPVGLGACGLHDIAAAVTRAGAGQKERPRA